MNWPPTPHIGLDQYGNLLALYRDAALAAGWTPPAVSDGDPTHTKDTP